MSCNMKRCLLQSVWGVQMSFCICTKQTWKHFTRGVSLEQQPFELGTGFKDLLKETWKMIKDVVRMVGNGCSVSSPSEPELIHVSISEPHVDKSSTSIMSLSVFTFCCNEVYYFSLRLIQECFIFVPMAFSLRVWCVCWSCWWTRVQPRKNNSKH